MKLLKTTVAAVTLLSAGSVIAQSNDAAAGFAQAQSSGTTLPEYVAQMTDLKTCNPKLSEQVVQFAVDKAKDDPALVNQILKAVNTGCVDADALTAIAVGAGVDPSVVSGAIATATAAPAAGPQGITPAATPANSGATGGTTQASTN